MALERETITRKDFPVGPQGYDPAAVDAHLSAIADEVEELKRAAHQRSETLAATTSDQVRAILEAAEKTAAGIHAEAGRESREHLGRVSQSTTQMLARLETMESELATLAASLRAGANRLTADMGLLESEVKDLSGASPANREVTPAAADATPAAAPEPVETVPTEAVPEPEPVLLQHPETLGATGHDTAKETPAEPPDAPAEEATRSGPEAKEGDDAAGARLIALNMALNGSPREETDRYLAENFQLPDKDRLLDEVYATVKE